MEMGANAQFERKHMNTNILVTIICTAYNHEKYISDAIDGFLMQKTNFDYEVLIHDDASTDKTADIIRKYAREYPEIVIPIIQEKNQVSQGVQIYKEYLYPKGKGKYFAICEGDDYWTDETKLQKQIDFLETHQDYSMCCHNSTRLHSNTGELVVENPVKEEGDVTPYEIILEPYKTWIATASLVFRRELAFNRPAFFAKLPVGDMQLRLHCFTKGRVYYFKKPMSVYRIDVEGSYLYSYARDMDIRLNFQYSYITFLRNFDEYTDMQYHKCIVKRIKNHKQSIKTMQADYYSFRKTKYYKSKPLLYKLKHWSKYHYPSFYKEIKSTKKKAKK